MSLQAHCNCGWSGEVSEAYLNDHVSCPDCGRSVPVRQNSIPYGYEPFSTWPSQSKPKPRLPARPLAPAVVDRRTSDGEAWSALIFGAGALFFSTGVHVGWLVALVMGVGALICGSRARSLADSERRPRPLRALVGMLLAILALLLASATMLSPDRCRRDKPPLVHVQEFELRSQAEAPRCIHAFINEQRQPALPPLPAECSPELPDELRDAARCFKEWHEDRGKGFNLRDFQRFQAEYSERVRQARMPVDRD
jgi:hypothetical protein